jgi:hypothetical protein
MTLRRLRFVLVFCLFVPAGSSTAAVILDEVPVRVYHTTGLPRPALLDALDVARATLGGAGVTVGWLECTVRDTAPRCATAPRPGELVLRVVNAGNPTQPAAAASAALRSPVSPLPLGDAFVDLGSQSGVLATVYLDRVSILAGPARIDNARLLGHAIAHEIGHLLLGTNAHSTAGLMRAVWSREDVRRRRAADWTFTAGDATAIRARLEWALVLGRK